MASLDDMMHATVQKLSTDLNNQQGWMALAGLHHMQGTLGQAINSIEMALTLDPSSAQAIAMLAGVLNDLDEFTLAQRWAERATIANVTWVDGWLALGHALAVQGQHMAASRAWGKAAGYGAEAAARTNLGMMQLGVAGPSPTAWENRDQRWQGHPGFAARQRFNHLPRWDGTPRWRKLIVWPEQGVGDEIVYFSQAADLAAAGYEVTWICDPRLQPLLQRSCPKVTVMPDNQDTFIHCATEGEVQISSGSVCRWLRPTIDSFPKTAHYLTPDPLLIAEQFSWLRPFVPGPAHKLLIGVVWRSLFQGEGRRQNYLTLEQLEPILRLPNIVPVSIQPGYYDPEIDTFERVTGVRIIRPTFDLKDDFESTAALCRCLDIVIGPGTTVVGLAAAVGTPAWQISPPKERDWMCLGTDAYPWLPMLSVFRPPWDKAIAKMVRTLDGR